MKITESRANDILRWLDDETGNHALLFEKMTLHRDAAALIRQLQAADGTKESLLRAASVLVRELDAAEQAVWHAGLDAGREQKRGKDHAQHPPSAPVGVDAEIETLKVEVAAQRTRADVMAGEAIKHEARAERLAEALREAFGQVRELCGCYGHAYPEASFARYEVLLHPTAAQEGQ